jgi:hypothetical protein
MLREIREIVNGSVSPVRWRHQPKAFGNFAIGQFAELKSNGPNGFKLPNYKIINYKTSQGAPC